MSATVWGGAAVPRYYAARFRAVPGGVGFGMESERYWDAVQQRMRRLMIHRAAVRCGGVRFGMSCAGTRSTRFVSATGFVGFASARFVRRV